MLAFFPTVFWDNLTLAEKLLGCDFRFWERFLLEKVFVIFILQIERQFWVVKRRGKCWPFFPHSFWDHLTLAEKLLGSDFRLENLTLKNIWSFDFTD